MQPEDILTPKELARRLKVPESWVFEKTRARQRNPLPALRIGRYLRFDWPAVALWLESTVKPSPAKAGLKPGQGRAA